MEQLSWIIVGLACIGIGLGFLVDPESLGRWQPPMFRREYERPATLMIVRAAGAIALALGASFVLFNLAALIWFWLR